MVALGLVLIYKASGVINFAQGQFGAFGALLMTLLNFNYGIPIGVGLPLAILCGAALGGVTELLVVRRLFYQPRLLLFVATLGVSQLIIYLGYQLPEQKNPGTRLLYPELIRFDKPWSIGPSTSAAINCRSSSSCRSCARSSRSCSPGPIRARASGPPPTIRARRRSPASRSRRCRRRCGCSLACCRRCPPSSSVRCRASKQVLPATRSARASCSKPWRPAMVGGCSRFRWPSPAASASASSKRSSSSIPDSDGSEYIFIFVLLLLLRPGTRRKGATTRAAGRLPKLRAARPRVGESARRRGG